MEPTSAFIGPEHFDESGVVLPVSNRPRFPPLPTISNFSRNQTLPNGHSFGGCRATLKPT
jgi:hypothetical protein